ncbi:DUF2163 domain-containing protein [Pontixanthobacter aquaemixtae]|uniref:DUF2163 domain-containing protein n=1 Tax=Pontixanthobacter aquaemixtae TaxID=1958940 RepID=A0A845A0N2_9SPHN|nr:DUF2163 domain-containing protein [Pontixanthobacter aquaemixtae]MXO91229.1 DUF2163 domain-containing protein [Pontixanthobacter aquaemixtae]
MSHVFFRKELEGVANFWRIFRRDGVTLGFNSHDRDLWFDGILHRAAPGMVPSAIRRTADLSPDSVEVSGVLSHSSIGAEDLAAGRFDNAAIIVGAVDWETLDRASLYSGKLGAVTEDGASFTADLHSAKAALDCDHVPRTSPTCRAAFCGPGCTLSAAKFTTEAAATSVDPNANSVTFSGIQNDLFVHGEVRWLGGPHAGMRMQVLADQSGALLLDTPLSTDIQTGARAILTQGCDHLLATCSARFGNAVNFQGEPFLPGNDLLARYPLPR